MDDRMAAGEDVGPLCGQMWQATPQQQAHLLSWVRGGAFKDATPCRARGHGCSQRFSCNRQDHY